MAWNTDSSYLKFHVPAWQQFHGFHSNGNKNIMSQEFYSFIGGSIRNASYRRVEKSLLCDLGVFR